MSENLALRRRDGKLSAGAASPGAQPPQLDLEESGLRALRTLLTASADDVGAARSALESDLAADMNVAHAVACSGTSAALHLSMMALGLGAGDLVLVPALSRIATANAVRLTGAHIVFTDVDERSGLITADTIRKAAEGLPAQSIKAVVPAHLGGRAPDIDMIAHAARDLGLRIIEDGALGHGRSDPGTDGAPSVRAFNNSTARVLSFDDVCDRHIGALAAVLTDSEEFAQSVRLLCGSGIVRSPSRFVDRSLSFDRHDNVNPWAHELHALGLDYEPSALMCLLARHRLAEIDHILAHRRALARRYHDRLSTVAHLTALADPSSAWAGWSGYPVLIDLDAIDLDRAQFARALCTQGIETDVGPLPLYHHPYYKGLYGERRLRGAETYHQKTLSLPLASAMSLIEVDQVCAAIVGLTEKTPRLLGRQFGAL